MMLDALSITWQSLRDFGDEFVFLVVLNVLWSLTVVLPLAPFWLLKKGAVLPVLILSLLLALPLPIVSGAFCFVANQVTRGKAVGWRTFVVGLRRYWAKSLMVAMVNSIVLFLILSNIQFYSVVVPGAWSAYVVVSWLLVGVYWLLVQVFWFPMILELESEKVLVALRSALAMVIVTPAFSLTLLLVLAVLVALCVLLSLPAVLILAGLLLLVANHATRSRLAFAQKKPYPPPRSG